MKTSIKNPLVEPTCSSLERSLEWRWAISGVSSDEDIVDCDMQSFRLGLQHVLTKY